ncbi:MAG: nucleotidyltransferase family protein [Bacteroidetes bacterium]|nr:nucleotidyltransferase family protein [Bacteroidota bacterium]
MEAIVLAGGFGTRLQKMVSDVPKSMALINQRPFLEYLFDYLVLQGVTSIVLSVGYKHEMISGHFGEQYKTLSIQYAIETEPLGTGGGIRLALWKINGLRALVMNGDSLFKLDYKALMEFHLKKKADATLALRKLKDTGRYGRVSVNRSRRITGFEEKGLSAAPGYINGGVYIVEKYFLMEPEFRGRFSMEKDCFEQYYPAANFFGFPAEGYFLDIGIPEDYLKAQHEFASFTD